MNKQQALQKIEELKNYIKTLEKQEIKHEIPGKTIYWGEEAPERMDWYEAKEWCEEQGGRLPTRIELLYAYEDDIGGFSDGHYWSSSEYSSDFVWDQDFDYGGQFDRNKGHSHRVRCLRDKK